MINNISYKGYSASVTYDEGTLLIKVINIKDLLIATCDYTSEVENTLKNLIDSYLEDCSELNLNPCLPNKENRNES